MTTKTAAQRGTAVSVKSLAITAICLVLVYVFTAVVNIRLPFAPNGGLIHLGNVPLFVAAILFGKRTGMIAGGIGMALFDLLSGWTLWAPFTLVIVGCMGFVVGAVTEKKKSFPFYLLALLLACAIKIGGYYLAEAVIYQNWVVPLTSIPGNLIQVGAAAIITLVVIEPPPGRLPHHLAEIIAAFSPFCTPNAKTPMQFRRLFAIPFLGLSSRTRVEKFVGCRKFYRKFFKIIVAFRGVTCYTFICKWEVLR